MKKYINKIKSGASEWFLNRSQYLFILMIE